MTLFEQLQNAPRLPNGMPKILHQIWLGGDCPARWDAHRQSWHTTHHLECGWLHVLWTDELVAELLPQMISRAAWDSPNGDMLAVRSSLLRYEVLRLFGGIYADVDIMIFRRFVDLLPSGDRLWYVDWRPHVPSNLCMIATPGHAAFTGIIERIMSERAAHGSVKGNRAHKDIAGDNAWCRFIWDTQVFVGTEMLMHAWGDEEPMRIGASWEKWGHLCYNTFLNLNACCASGDHETWRELVLGSQRSFGVHEVACTWFDKY